MSLLDPFVVCDAVLETVMQQDIYLAVRTDAPLGGGAGTWDDPFYAANPSLTDAANAALFDGIMNDTTKVPSGSTVRLGPGTFCTAGSEANGTGAWHPRNGRIVGAGIGVTTLKLVSVPASKVRYAIGMNLASGGLDGFEASDFSIDCNYAGNTQTGSGCCGIAVHGTHVYLHRIKVSNFGYRAASMPSVGVIVGAAGGSVDSVIEQCVVESPGSGNVGVMTFFAFAGTKSAPHFFCVIRDCAGRAINSFENPIPTISLNQYTAINPGAGVGVVLEGNQVANCFWGVACSIAGRDLIVRNNYFRNVNRGVDLYVPNPDITDRVIILENIIELSTTVMNPIPTGIGLGGGAGGDRFKDLILRRNIIRDVNQPLGVTSGILGLQITSYTQGIVENNILDNFGDTSAFYYNGSALTLKSFNNQSSAGKLFRAWNPSTTLFKQELADLAETAIIDVTGRPPVI